jgi:hypothetical protein
MLDYLAHIGFETRWRLAEVWGVDGDSLLAHTLPTALR